MDASAPCVNSRPPRPHARLLGPSPIRTALPFVLILVHSGCAGVSSDERAARAAAERWLEAAASGDSAEAAKHGVCRMPGSSFQGSTVLRVERVRRLIFATLDSLAGAAGVRARRAAAAFELATEVSAESLWLRRDRADRHAALWRDARRAVAASARGLASGSPDPIRSCRIRVRFRWGGPLVGPVPVDREHVVRLVAARGGPWIVYSWLAPDRDPAGAPF